MCCVHWAALHGPPSLNMAQVKALHSLPVLGRGLGTPQVEETGPSRKHERHFDVGCSEACRHMSWCMGCRTAEEWRVQLRLEDKAVGVLRMPWQTSTETRDRKFNGLRRT